MLLLRFIVHFVLVVIVLLLIDHVSGAIAVAELGRVLVDGACANHGRLGLVRDLLALGANGNTMPGLGLSLGFGLSLRFGLMGCGGLGVVPTGTRTCAGACASIGGRGGCGGVGKRHPAHLVIGVAAKVSRLSAARTVGVLSVCVVGVRVCVGVRDVEVVTFVSLVEQMQDLA